MEKKLKAIVLGGTNPHISLIKNLQKRGYYVILVDLLENSPAKKFADKYIKESTLEEEKVLNIAKRLKVDLVISTCIDQANATACYVSEKLHLPAPYSYNTALNVTNKRLMKRKMLKNGIPTSKYIFIKNNSITNISNLKFPVMVKPADGCGSKGVRKANNLQETKNYLKIALRESRKNEAVIEEYKEGIEVSVDCFIQNKKTFLITMNQRLSVESNNKSVMRCFSIITPAEISYKAKKNIQRAINKIAEAFNLNNTPLFAQIIVRGDDINIIEFAPRVGGSLNFRTVKLNSGFDILNSAVNSFLGLKVNVKYKYSKFYYATNNVYAKPCIFGYISGYKELIEKKIIEEFFQDKGKGMESGLDMASRDRIATFLVRGRNKSELYQKTKIAMNKLEVYNISGNPVMMRDVFLGSDEKIENELA